ncbi:MAG: phenylalanine--tRNA ligase subunit beta [Bacteroidetes bacterium]|nr:phenylalanine--tRNA ligase subunit beta [Bacteroidota bacterium]
MRISYNWLRKYINTSLSVQQISELLTDIGLEVESVEKFETVPGGLQGIVIGEVKTKEKHPDADKLSITTVDVGGSELLQIVCGASNVAAGQKVVVATIGATLYPVSGEPFKIKKSKIRGQNSEGMICAEDEIGLGNSHDGIMVLPNEVAIGTPAASYFKLESDFVFEIGLTANRSDATSHMGVARDLAAAISCRGLGNFEITEPQLLNIPVNKGVLPIEIEIADTELCPRYSGLYVRNIQVKESPEWLKNSLKSIGLKPINNIVDITNYVLFEYGQPLHAFDADKISGNKIVVKRANVSSKFTTLDSVERTLSGEELLICNESEPMCIAGVFGGLHSGITTETKNLFLESAYFNPVSIRKTAKQHNLKTDAAFRYERGADPNITVKALQRAAFLLSELAEGTVVDTITDVYPSIIEPIKIGFSYKSCDAKLGKELERSTIKNIFKSIGVAILSEGTDALLVTAPTNKADVTREIDLIEEVIRIYGINNIELPTKLNSSVSFSVKPNKQQLVSKINDLLVGWGFSEIMCTSLTSSKYYSASDLEKAVKLANPMSADLDILRNNLLYSGLETIAYNQNRKNTDLKLFELGKIYQKSSSEKWAYVEEEHLSFFMCGNVAEVNWNSPSKQVTFFHLVGVLEKLIASLRVTYSKHVQQTDSGVDKIAYTVKSKEVASVISVPAEMLKKFDIKQSVFYATIHVDELLKNIPTKTEFFKDLPKFPEVKRDLALVVDEHVLFNQLKEAAFQVEKKMLKSVNIFDVYKGKNIEEGKKSYALNFVLQDEEATLTDAKTEAVMSKLMKVYEEKFGAKIRN